MMMMTLGLMEKIESISSFLFCFLCFFPVKIFFCLVCNEGDIIIVISCAFDKIIRVSRLFQ